MILYIYMYVKIYEICKNSIGDFSFGSVLQFPTFHKILWQMKRNLYKQHFQWER